jgi:hypothetical protein
MRYAQIPRLGGALSLTWDWFAVKRLHEIAKIKAGEKLKAVTRDREKRNIKHPRSHSQPARALNALKIELDRYAKPKTHVGRSVEAAIGNRLSQKYFDFGIKLQHELEDYLSSRSIVQDCYPTPLALMDMMLECSFNARKPSKNFYHWDPENSRWKLDDKESLAVMRQTFQAQLNC